MSLYGTSVSRPIATLMVFVAILVFGIFSLVQLPFELYPEIDPPMISVITTYPGAGPQEVEQNVTEEIEDALSTVNELEEITSTSMDNMSIINLEFTWSANLDNAANDVRDAIGRVAEQLPEDVDDPVIFRFSTASIPILILGATAELSYPNIREILENGLLDPLNRIAGVGSISILGGPQRIIKVKINPNQLQAYGLQIEQVTQILQAENATVPAGDFISGGLQYNIRIDTDFKSIDEIGQVVISNQDNRTVYLRDIATVADGIEEQQRIERVERVPGVRLVVQKQSGANTVDVVNSIKEVLPQLEKNLPQDIKLTVITDFSEFIIDSVLSLGQVLIFAIVFVVMIVWFFIRRWRATFIVAITIPFSLIAAFIYLYVTDNTLNLISLSSLSIALGMVVDDAIVVFENIATHLQKGSNKKEAAIYGTGEVGFAVIATTLTVIAVFFPLTLLSGITGIWFKQLGYIVCITISISTLAALSLIPMLSSTLLRQKTTESKTGLRRKIYASIEDFLERMDTSYQSMLTWSLHHKRIVLFIPIIMFVSSLFLIGFIGVEFIPITDNGRFTAQLELRTGASLEKTKEVMLEVEEIIYKEVPELKSIVLGAGVNTGTAFNASSSGQNIIDVAGSLTSAGDRDRSLFEIIEDLRNRFQKIPEVINYRVDVETGDENTNPIAIHVLGNDYAKISEIAEKISAKLREIEGTRGVDISTGEQRPEIQVYLDRVRLSQFGLNSGQVAQNIRDKFAGAIATDYSEQGEEFDIVVQYEKEFRNSLEDLQSLPIRTPEGLLIQLADVGRLVEVFSPSIVEHIDRIRSVTVSTDIYETTIDQVMEELRPFIEQLDLPENVSIDFGGDFEEQQESFADLFAVLGISVVLVYIVMAGQFESFKDPFIIMLSIPFAFTGVMLALFLTDTNLSVIAFVGAIILVGIVVKNAIVLVDYTNLLRGRGIALQPSIVDAGKSRLRPVLMTTLTTILAMLPLAFSKGEGAEIWKPMAISVIGGLTFSTIITLIFVPVMYSVFERKSDEKGGKRELVSPDKL